MFQTKAHHSNVNLIYFCCHFFAANLEKAEESAVVVNFLLQQHAGIPITGVATAARVSAATASSYVISCSAAVAENNNYARFK